MPIEDFDALDDTVKAAIVAGTFQPRDVFADDSVIIAGVKVLGAQGALIANATDAASVITQLNLLLARCRAHGIIAT